jgi:hypothetical protein
LYESQLLEVWRNRLAWGHRSLGEASALAKINAERELTVNWVIGMADFIHGDSSSPAFVAWLILVYFFIEIWGSFPRALQRSVSTVSELLTTGFETKKWNEQKSWTSWINLQFQTTMSSPDAPSKKRKRSNTLELPDTVHGAVRKALDALLDSQIAPTAFEPLFNTLTHAYQLARRQEPEQLPAEDASVLWDWSLTPAQAVSLDELDKMLLRDLSMVRDVLAQKVGVSS